MKTLESLRIVFMGTPALAVLVGGTAGGGFDRQRLDRSTAHPTAPQPARPQSQARIPRGGGEVISVLAKNLPGLEAFDHRRRGCLFLAGDFAIRPASVRKPDKIPELTNR